MTRSTALTSWKEIAHYLGKSVRTVQRWEHEFGLPVRRPGNYASKSAVLIETEELDHWMRQTFHRQQLLPVESDSKPFRHNTQLIKEAHSLVHDHLLIFQRTHQLRLELEKSCLLYSARTNHSQADLSSV